jgi:3alpha(or 20beta)-hydroxysteroid dehydrogenase
MKRLDGRVVLVTGGARGIGEAVVRRSVAEGASVTIGDIRDELGKRLAAEIGPPALFHHLDVTSEQDWEAAVAATVERFGKLDGLVNNAGVFEWCPLKDYELSNYLAVINVNQVGVFLGMRTAIPALEQAGGGTIVNVSSGAGLTGVANAIAYTASKFAVTGMTKTAAMELMPLGIRVNSVHPGFVRTPLTMGDETGTPGTMPTEDPRAVGPETIANLVLYLTSDESSYSTGSQFVADGGVSAGVNPTD